MGFGVKTPAGFGAEPQGKISISLTLNFVFGKRYAVEIINCVPFFYW